MQSTMHTSTRVQNDLPARRKDVERSRLDNIRHYEIPAVLRKKNRGLGGRADVNGSLWWKILQQVHGRGEVIVAGDGVDLPLAQLNEGLGLDPLRHSVRAVVRQHVVGEFGGPFEFACSQCLAPPSQYLVGATDQGDQLCCTILLRKRIQCRGISVEPAL